MTEAARAAAPRVKNQVHDAAIWRQTISYELSTAKDWEQNWGFMRGLYEHPKVSNSGKEYVKLPPLRSTVPRAFISGLPSKLPQGLTADPNSHTADLLSIHDVPRITRSLYPKQKYTFPATTQQEIGWDWEQDTSEQTKITTTPSVERMGTLHDDKKSCVDDMQRRFVADANPNPVQYRTLEKFGREARGQGDVLKWWGGTRESLP
ncbi:hypothetical protein PhCBS80983_g01355 [Powellomyces hirtus]|uniref:Uncharacterized protein n=1 Tax=Powellomyces hirtus TaxID=109895 RepID=A0A507EB93_9FUNG|nr:hypothetical protein DFJ77DRAFT_461778 [Powellomyces hirtus]TPX61046.1 hypothetical protein PhCBS80983_g01355 [Powellomyces hirtus]